MTLSAAACPVTRILAQAVFSSFSPLVKARMIHLPSQQVVPWKVVLGQHIVHRCHTKEGAHLIGSLNNSLD